VVKRQAREQAGEQRRAKADPCADMLLDGPDSPPAGLGPLLFLESLMDNRSLPISFRRDCASLILPFCAAKLPTGLKIDRNNPDFWDDDDGDEDGIAQALRN
jgi:hypothetical protein